MREFNKARAMPVPVVNDFLLANFSSYLDVTADWQMTRWERFTLLGLLSHLRPEFALEIGTYQGGSLQILSRFSKRTLSIDIDPGVAVRLQPFFPAVEFLTGDAELLVPKLVSEWNSTGIHPDFILIDGDHSQQGVQRDIANVLKIQPRSQIVLLMHDCFNPGCRAGMATAPWQECPYVHAVELDYVPGVYHDQAVDTAAARSLWGGLACAVLRPEPRLEPLTILESQGALHQAVCRAATAEPMTVSNMSRRCLRWMRARVPLR